MPIINCCRSNYKLFSHELWRDLNCLHIGRTNWINSGSMVAPTKFGTRVPHECMMAVQIKTVLMSTMREEQPNENNNMLLHWRKNLAQSSAVGKFIPLVCVACYVASKRLFIGIIIDPIHLADQTYHCQLIDD